MSTTLIIFHKFLRELLGILNQAVTLVDSTAIVAENMIATSEIKTVIFDLKSSQHLNNLNNLDLFRCQSNKGM